VLAALAQKILRVMRKAGHKAGDDPRLKGKLENLERLWGVAPVDLPKHLLKLGPEGAREFLLAFRQFPMQVEDVRDLLGSERRPLVSHEPDQFVSRTQATGHGERPDDYLRSFAEFVKGSLNDSVALSVVVNRPRDLTRKQLREIHLLLANHDFSETSLRVAWRNKTNQEIAAGIVAYIRQAALGEELVPYATRVERAMATIRARHPWTPMQTRWLDRIAKQLVDELVIDPVHLNEVFKTDGGLTGLNRHLGNRLDDVLETLATSLWVA
jgi:type I restriction enzyme R subunit